MDNIALICTLLGCATSLGVFGHRVLSQVMGRVDRMASDLHTDLDRRFAAAEAHRVEASSAYRVSWDSRHQMLTERVSAQAAEIADLRRQHEDDRRDLVDGYVSRATWIEHIGTTNIKLDKLLETLRSHATDIRITP